MNAIYVTYSLAMLLTLINLGSEVALNIITSLGTGALTCSYIVSISCIIRKRLVGEPLLPRPWSLGIWGLPINIIGVCFLILCFVMNFFPQSPKNLDATTFNWNILIVSFHSAIEAEPDR
jgi:choline transport protein